MRPRLTWLVAVPLALAGTEIAHELAYALADPERHRRAAALAASGHGYLAFAPILAVVGLGIVAVALAFRADQARRGRQGEGIARRLALVPPVAFAVQEHLERLVHSGSFPFAAALEPTFVVGLALQLPFALLTLWVARMLLRAADRLGAALARVELTYTALLLPVPISCELPRLAPLALGHSGRGPPARG
jgi:hypothetical protein